jgi:CzcA family heavy metal efflux pump
MSFARTVARQSRAILVMVVLLCLAGLYAARQLPVSIFPETNFPRIVIIVDNGVAPGSTEMASVTRPIEEAMSGIPGVVRITSTTARGGTDINLFFDWDTDIVQALQLVQGRISQLSSSLPAGATIRNVDRLTFAVFPVAGYSITSDVRGPMELRDLADNTIRPRLARLPGVAAVAVKGGEQREIHVSLDLARLAARGISPQQVSDALAATNILASPGLIEENHQLELTIVSGRADTAADLGKVVVATVNGTPVTVGELGTVGPGAAPAYTIVTADGRPAVLLNVRRQPAANTITVVDEVKDELSQMASTLPADVTIAPFYDQSLLVHDAMLSVRDAILIGLLLSVAILYVFLRNVGTTLVAITVIPVALLCTFFAMWRAGLGFDLMTLGGIAASIGLVIDDAIVVVENIHAHLSRRGQRALAVETAMTEITPPIIGSTITPVVVFLPLTLLTGITGVFFRSLALSMAVALLSSLVLALTFTPVLAARFIHVDANAPDGHDAGPVLGAVRARYEWLLRHALDHQKTVLAVAAGVVALSYGVLTHLGSDFLPSFDEGAFVLDYEAPAGTSLAETDRMLGHVQAILADTPEVESYSRRTGLQLALSITEPNTGDFLVKLKRERNRSIDEVTAAIRERVEASEPALNVDFAGILGDLLGDLIDSPSPVEIKLFSEDTDALEAQAHAIEDLIQTIPGVVDTSSGVIVNGPVLTFQVDPVRAARLGVNAADVARAVQTAMDGDEATTLLEHGRLITVRVRVRDDVRSSLETLKALPIRGPGGALFRLDQVADLRYESGVTEIDRDGLRRTVAVTARLDGVDLGTGIAQIKALLAEKLTLPPGMTLEYGGMYREEQRSFQELVLSLGVAVVLVFLVLLVQFRSFTHPIAIVSGSVLALSGVLVALYVTGTTLNVVSFMSMIMVVGIVAKNGILMLDAVEDHRKNGDTLREALLRSGRRRFRPVLMTSLAAILGMLPLALAIGSGAELLQPLAIGVIGGLTMALLLSLVVTPTVYALLHRDERDAPIADDEPTTQGELDVSERGRG